MSADLPTLRSLTMDQERAAAGLERALAEMHRVGLLVCGMDDRLTAYRADDFERLEGSMESAYEIQSALIAADTQRDIDDHGAYRESGTW